MPQLGAMIGGMIGNYISPDVINGPSIGDAQQQTAQAGIPRPVVYGHPAPFAGNIIDGEAKARKIKVKRKDDGKGNYTITKEEHFVMTYAIRICEGPIAGIARAWRNGKIVADYRDESMIPAYANGDAAARGRSIAEGRAATLGKKTQIRFYNGTEDQLPDPALEAIHGVGNTPYYRGTAYMVVVDDDVTDMGGAAAQWQFEVIGVGAPGGNATVVMGSVQPVYRDGIGGNDAGWIEESRYLIDVSSVSGIYNIIVNRSGANSTLPVRAILEYPDNGEKIFDSYWLVGSEAARLAFQSASWTYGRIYPETGGAIHMNPGTQLNDFLKSWMAPGASSVVDSVSSGTQSKPFRLNTLRLRLIHASLDSNFNGKGWRKGLEIRSVPAASMPSNYTISPDVPDMLIGGDGKLYYPDWVTSAPFQTIKPTAITVGAVVDDIARRSGVGPDKIDTSVLTQSIPGMIVATQCTASEACKPIQQMYFFDLPEFDGKIRAVQRGGPVVTTLIDANMVYSQGDETRAQHIEFPLAVTVVTRSPEAEYSPLPQTSRRSSNNVTALGESRIESPIPMSPNEAMRRADIVQKAMWARAEGTAEKWLPDQYSYLVPSDCVTYNGKRWLIENVSMAEGKMKVTMVIDRAAAYSSDMLAAPIRRPDFPVYGLAETTIMVVAQLPALREAEKGQTGFYVMCSGYSDGWSGCVVQMSLYDGQFVKDMATITMPSEIGKLDAPLAVGDSSAQVRMQYGELYSITGDGINVGANAAVIVPASTMGEIIQNTTSTETADGVYTLTGLYRGRLGTGVVAHGTGEAYATVSDAVFIPVDPKFIGKTISVRAVTLGTQPETAPWQKFTLADQRVPETQSMYLLNNDSPPGIVTTAGAPVTVEVVK